MNIYNYLIQIILSGIGVITFIKTSNFMTNTFNARRAPILTIIAFALFEVIVVTSIALVKKEFYTDLILDIIINAVFLFISCPIIFYENEKKGMNMIRNDEITGDDISLVSVAVNISTAIKVIMADIVVWSVYRLIIKLVER